MKIARSTLKRLWQSLIPVFKPLTLYLGIYYFALFFVLTLIQTFLGEGTEAGAVGLVFVILDIILAVLVGLCPPFLVPYYAFRHEKPSLESPPFSSFVLKTVWPLFLNYLLVFLVILLYALPIVFLLIGQLVFKWPIPMPLQLVLYFLFALIPIYKGIRYLFINCVVFFDGAYKNKEISALKASHRVTGGCFWSFIGTLFGVLFLFVGAILLVTVFSLPFSNSSSFVEGLQSAQGGELTGNPPDRSITSFLLGSMSGCVIQFYASCFYILFLCQFYFEVKTQKEESISW